MVKAVGVATSNFRYVTRGLDVHPQQLYLVTEGAGSTKERTYSVWLDVDCSLFKATETDRERDQREHVESLGKEFAIKKA